MTTIEIRVMRRESVGRPYRGDRSKLRDHTYAVVEYHGKSCFEVITGTDSLPIATEMATKHARAISGVVVNALGKRAVSTRKKTTAPKGKPTATRVKTPARKSGTADAQKLHVRDIKATGTCQACRGGSSALSLTCGSEVVTIVETTVTATVDAVPAPPAAGLTLADVMAATEHLRA